MKHENIEIIRHVSALFSSAQSPLSEWNDELLFHSEQFADTLNATLQWRIMQPGYCYVYSLDRFLTKDRLGLK